MENNIIMPCSQNKKARILFFTFEIAAAIFFAVFFITAIVDGARYSSFEYFLNETLTGTFYAFVLFGFGKVIDLLSCKNECKKEKTEEKKEEKTDKE